MTAEKLFDAVKAQIKEHHRAELSMKLNVFFERLKESLRDPRKLGEFRKDYGLPRVGEREKEGEGSKDF